MSKERKKERKKVKEAKEFQKKEGKKKEEENALPYSWSRYFPLVSEINVQTQVKKNQNFGFWFPR